MMPPDQNFLNSNENGMPSKVDAFLSSMSPHEAKQMAEYLASTKKGGGKPAAKNATVKKSAAKKAVVKKPAAKKPAKK